MIPRNPKNERLKRLYADFLKHADGKAKPQATVETKQGFGSVPAGRFLSPQVDGGQRRKKSHELKLGDYTVPGKDITLNAYGNILGSTYVKILSQLRLSSDPSQNASNSKLSKAKRKREAFFKRENVIYSRKGEDITPMLILTRAPSYRQRLPFFEEARIRRASVVFPTWRGPAMKTILSARSSRTEDSR